jgi:uncharacterized protein YqgC (DUF456 family)
MSRPGTLASRCGTWQGSGMATSSPPAGGVFVALGAIVGAVIGLIYDQPSLGLVIGLAVGAAMALMIWWRSRG